jgi:L-lactate dehydrogenase complex protein LldE
MKVALSIPCFMDAFYPNGAKATLELLEKLGVDVVYPEGQTCCGQPMSSLGFYKHVEKAEHHFAKVFEPYDYIVMPSASCTHQVRDNYDRVEQTDDIKHVRSNIYELVEFLTDVLKVKELPWAKCSEKVVLHNSCTAVRGIKHCNASEEVVKPFSKPQALLDMVEGIEMCQLERHDECCGFGGAFCVVDEAISAAMGQDKVKRQKASGAVLVTSADSSCMMHQSGIAEKENVDLKYVHIAEILNGDFA